MAQKRKGSLHGSTRAILPCILGGKIKVTTATGEEKELLLEPGHSQTRSTYWLTKAFLTKAVVTEEICM